MPPKRPLRGDKILYFKRIEMQGFKSFAEPVSIDLTEGITCIVGPNGSGKSNISDAISWVLGEQSPKLLRGGKMDEVIFAGTASRKSRGMAEVTLVIDNSSGILPIDYGELAITRRMYRSGESEYAINNNLCRLRDIRELIMDTGIGVDGYSIIRQGKISDIISNRTESRREIFESAAGIVTYRNKKAEASRKLDASNQQLDRVNDIINEIEKRIGGLKEDSEKAALYLELRERFRELEINITLKNIDRINDNSQGLLSELTRSKEEIEAIKKEKGNLDQEVEETRDCHQSLESQISKLSEKQLSLINSINELLNEGKIYGERQSNLEININRLLEEISEAEERLVRERGNAERQRSVKKEADSKAEEANLKVEEKTRKRADLASAHMKLLERIEELKGEVFSLLNFEAGKKAEAQSIDGLKTGLVKQKDRILSEEEKEKEDFKELSGLKEELEGFLQGLTAEIGNLEDNLKGLKLSTQKKSEEEENTGKGLENLIIKRSQILARKKTIEEMEANYEGYNHAVKFIMRSQIGGLHGTVAELIKVPKGYEIAIETALGGNIQNIVCKDDKSAEKAINLLKEEGAGRLTFLPVESIKPEKLERAEGIKKAGGFLGFATDLVGTDKDYHGVLEYLLGKVLVMEDMASAVTLSKSYRGFRFVTLEGEFINAGGAITGGRHQNKTANLLERKAEIERLSEDLEELEKSKLRAEEARNSLIREREELLNIISQAEGDLRIKEMARLTKEGDIKAIKDQIFDFERRKNLRINELSDMEKEMKNSLEISEGLLNEAREAGRKAREYEEKIEKLLVEERDLKEKLEKFNESLIKDRMDMSSRSSEKEGIDQLLQLIEKTISDLRQEKEKKEGLLTVYREEKEKIILGTGETDNPLKSQEAEKQSVEAKLLDLKAEKNQIFEKLSRVSKEKEELDKRLEVLAASRMDMEIKQGKNETLLDTYKEKLWEEFEVSYVQALEWRKEDFVFSHALKENREIKNQMRDLGEVNVGAIMEYREVKERYDFLTEQREDILKATEDLIKIIKDTDKIIKARFKESFDNVAENFQGFFKELFDGGNAQLVLEDPENPLESEIDIVAQPPGKKLSNISLLSGGEKTLTAIALMFAVLKTKPTPFCILDEVEAALDESNINRFIKSLKGFEGSIQFALVTHQKATMEHADTLYGVTMAEQGVSKIISLKLGDEFDLGDN